MAGDVQDYVGNCQLCLRNMEMQYRPHRVLWLFLTTETFEFVAINVFGLLRKYKAGNNCISVITDRLNKFTRSISLKYTTYKLDNDASLTY